MHPISLYESSRTVSVLEPYDAEACRWSEVTWLPVTWASICAWQVPVQVMGIHVSDPSASVRIEKARNLLLNPNYEFSEIAAELGFDSVNDFNEAFTRTAGQSPRAYRERLPDWLCCAD